jgi:hypothetical protein
MCCYAKIDSEESTGYYPRAGLEILITHARYQYSPFRGEFDATMSLLLVNRRGCTILKTELVGYLFPPYKTFSLLEDSVTVLFLAY